MPQEKYLASSTAKVLSIIYHYTTIGFNVITKNISRIAYFHVEDCHYSEWLNMTRCNCSGGMMAQERDQIRPTVDKHKCVGPLQRHVPCEMPNHCTGIYSFYLNQI